MHPCACKLVAVAVVVTAVAGLEGERGVPTGSAQSRGGIYRVGGGYLQKSAVDRIKIGGKNIENRRRIAADFEARNFLDIL